ncbi:hypothetical protein GTW56_19635 [Bacillus sp. EB93]|nr:hypothetical protein [Peribacillus frigoritolerans]
MAEKQDEMGSIFSFIKGQVDKLPISQSKKTKMLDQLLKLKTMTVDAREPRIALVGRRGSGKSSLINAMFGQERQYVSSVKSGTGKGNGYGTRVMPNPKFVYWIHAGWVRVKLLRKSSKKIHHWMN